MRKVAPFILLVLPILTVTLPTHAQHQLAMPRISWVASFNPSSSIDNAESICVIGDYVFVIGNYNVSLNDTAFRVEKMSKHDGKPIATWVYNPSPSEDHLFDCVVANNMLYVVGEQSTPEGDTAIAIIVLDQNLRLIRYVTSNPTSYGDGAFAVATDGEYLYVGGAIDFKRIFIFDVSEWYIEVRRLTDLYLMKSYLGPEKDVNMNAVLGLGVNPVSGDIWSVGGAGLREDILLGIIGDGLVRILDKDMRLRREMNISEETSFFDVTFDDYGYGYVVGLKYIVKFDRYGNEVARTYCDYCFGVVSVHDQVYALGLDVGWTESSLVLRVFDRWLNLLTSIELVRGEAFYLAFGKIAFDGRYLYIAVSRKVGENDYEWVVVSVDTGLTIRYTTVTVTATTTIFRPVTETTTIKLTSTVTNTVTMIFAVTRVETETRTITETIIKPYTETKMSTITTIKEITATFTKTEVLTKFYTETMTEIIRFTVTEARTVIEKDWLAIGLTAIIAVLLFPLGYLLGRIKYR